MDFSRNYLSPSRVILDEDFRTIDPVLIEFAESSGCSQLRANDHDWPSRNLYWNAGGILRYINMWLSTESPRLYNTYLYAATLDEIPRRTKQRAAFQSQPFIQDQQLLADLLAAWSREIHEWQDADLVLPNRYYPYI